MSAFVLVLAAGMVVGSGPEKVSAEVEQGLDLTRGKWEGFWLDARGRTRTVVLRPWRPDRVLVGCGPAYPFACRDEGRGAIRGNFCGEPFVGIFRWDGECLTLCVREVAKGRPAFFQGGDGQHLIRLYRAEPDK
jgi:hypothetical protein